jgi:hypothetical protein
MLIHIITFTAAAPTLSLRLDGPLAVLAQYTSGSGTTVLTFTYVVGAGHHALLLDCTPSTATTMPLTACFGCIVATQSGAPIYLNSIAEPGLYGSLSSNVGLTIDGTALFVNSVTASVASGIYGAGQVIRVYIDFLVSMAAVNLATMTLQLNTLRSGVAVPLTLPT